MNTQPRTVSAETRNVLNSIRRIVQALRVGSRESEKKVGLSAAQLFVLQKLNEESGLSLNELAERSLTHQSSVSVVVQRLVDKKFIVRERSKEDARQLVLNISAKGKATLKKAPSAKQDWLIGALERMDPKERKQLDRTFTSLLASAKLSTKSPAPMLFADKGEPETKRRTKK